VEISSDHILLNALDNRAATYEKLGQLQLALRDAKEMIDRMPKVSKVSHALLSFTYSLTRHTGISSLRKSLAIEEATRCCLENL
jgi:F-box/TPR repeat protein Pof3